MAWIYPTENQQGWILLYEKDGQAGVGLRLLQSGSSHGVRMYAMDREYDDEGSLSKVSGITLNDWNHVTAMYDYESGQATIIINGNTDSSGMTNRVSITIITTTH